MDSSRITRRDFHRLMMAAGAGFLVSPEARAAVASSACFVHPGILHTAADLERMRKAVREGRQPIAGGFEKLRQHPFSSLRYAPHQFATEIGRNPSVHFAEFDSDAGAAYQCSLMAAITGDRRYSERARTIVLGWSASLERVTGADAVLMAGLGPFKLVNAAEILRHLGELDAQNAASCAAMLKRAILPTIIDFAPFANGNWDTAAVKTMLAIAVFSDDEALFERALLCYLHGDGDGRLTHYIYGNGQCQESGRDQQHTQLGLAHMGDACQIAWNQGWDLFGAKDNRLLRGFEYTAAYNLGEAVEFRPDVDRTGQYRHRVISPRGTLRPIYEQIYAHYCVRRGLAAPAVERAVQKGRPEGSAQGADHTGFGTLLYACNDHDPDPAPIVPPAALAGQWRGNAVELKWLAAREPGAARLERDGVDVRVESRAGLWRDVRVVPGRHYRYEFWGPAERFRAAPITLVAGLPAGWATANLGHTSVAGDVQFEDETVTLYASGKGLMQPTDEGHFAAAPATSSRIAVRWIPQIASQYAMFGLACRSGFEPDALAVSLLIAPGGGFGMRRSWHVRLMARDASGKVSILSDHALAKPAVSYGRLVGPVWFRMEIKGALLDAAFSIDGGVWNSAGQAQRPSAGRLGLILSSGVPEIASAARFNVISQ